MSVSNVGMKLVSRSAAWSALESGGLSLLSFLSLIVYARLLTPSDFGVVATALAAVELFSIVTGMTFHDALVQKSDVTDRHYNTAFTLSLGVGVLFAAMAWVLAPAFEALIGEPGSGSILGWLGISFVFSGAGATLIARHRREFLFKTLALRSLIGRLLGLAVGMVAAVLGAGAWSLVAQQLAMVALGTAVIWASAPQGHRPCLQFGRREFSDLIVFGGLSVAALFASFAVKRVFIMSCGFFLGAQTAGLLNLAFRLVDTLWSVTATAIQQVALPTLSALQTDRIRLLNAYSLGVRLGCVMLYPIFLGLGATADDVVELLFGEQWRDSGIFVSVLSALIILQVPRILAVPLLTALGFPSRVLWSYLTSLAFLSIAISVTQLSSVEVGLGIWIATEIILVPVLSYCLSSASGLSFFAQYKIILSPLVASITMVTVVLLLRLWLGEAVSTGLRLLTCSVSGGLVYFVMLYFIDRNSLVGSLKIIDNAVRRS